MFIEKGEYFEPLLGILGSHKNAKGGYSIKAFYPVSGVVDLHGAPSTMECHVFELTQLVGVFD